MPCKNFSGIFLFLEATWPHAKPQRDNTHDSPYIAIPFGRLAGWLQSKLDKQTPTLPIELTDHHPRSPTSPPFALPTK